MQKLKCKTRFTNAHVHDAGVHTLPTAAAALIEIDINIKYYFILIISTTNYKVFHYVVHIIKIK